MPVSYLKRPRYRAGSQPEDLARLMRTALEDRDLGGAPAPPPALGLPRELAALVAEYMGSFPRRDCWKFWELDEISRLATDYGAGRIGWSQLVRRVAPFDHVGEWLYRTFEHAYDSVARRSRARGRVRRLDDAYAEFHDPSFRTTFFTSFYLATFLGRDELDRRNGWVVYGKGYTGICTLGTTPDPETRLGLVWDWVRTRMGGEPRWADLQSAWVLYKRMVRAVVAECRSSW
ncbi:MAG: hypothetical protein ACO38I_03960 [Ilumatobacteraceae bacterium]